MQTAQLKKTVFRLTNSRTRLLLCKIVATISLLLHFNYNVIAQSNTVYGIEALKISTADINNSAFGYAALHANTTGFANTAHGVYALFSNTTGYHNTANGVYTLRFNTTGYLNTANGFGALYSNTTGNSNTANGALALYYNTTGSYNTASGQQALYFNTTGHDNTANGLYALLSNTVGNWNTANGSWALSSNTTGNANTASGVYAIQANKTGSYNTANGQNALYMNTSGSYNTGNGFGTLQSNTIGNYNTALGYNANVASDNLTNATAIGANAKVTASNTIQLGNDSVTKVFAGVDKIATLIAGGLQITGGTPAVGKVLTSDANGVANWQTPTIGWGLTGNAGTVDGINFIGTTDNVPFNIRFNNEKAGRIDANNAFYGYQSGNARTTGGFNTAMGFQSLNSLTTGDGNTAIGDRSLLANTIGNYNTAVGSLALSSNIDGKYNTAIGYAANVKNGFSNSTAIGNNTLVNGNNSTAIGNNTIVNGSNSTAIGNNTVVNGSDKIRLGDALVKVIEGTVMYTVSDGRFKTNISEEEVKGLAFIQKLRPVVYNFDTKKFQAFLTQNMPADARQKYMDKDFSASTAIRQSGFIAQEVEKAAQEVGYNFNGVHKPESANDNYSLAYSQFVVPLVKAVQEQEQKIEQQEKKIEYQQKINDQLQQRMEALEKRMAGNSNLSNEPITKITTSSEAEEGLKLFPNPTTGVFTIMANHITNATIEVYDMLGNNVKKEMLANIKSGYSLDLSGHAKGTYWVNIISGNKKYTKQIVVQ